MPEGIILFGANGAGKTSLGRELARTLNFKHMDIEDYYFEESEIPYTKPRPREQCLRLMLADIEKHDSFVISSCTGDFGEKINSLYSLAVHMTAPKELRIKRIEQRGHARYGDRVREGGDMYEQQIKFNNYIASRPLVRIEQWAEKLACPVIRVDGTEDWRVNAANIAELFNETIAESGDIR